MMKKILQEPTLHFALLGALLFVLWSLVGEPEAPANPEEKTIVVTGERVEQLRRQHTLRTGSPPDSDTVESLVQDWITDEVLFREALALGLHRSDEIVRRRLIQVMGFLLEDLAPVPEPEEEELRAWYHENKDRYTEPDRISFDHIFLGETPETGDATAVKEALASGHEWNQLGKPFISGLRFVSRSEKQIVAVFGEPFARSVFALDGDGWGGPVESVFGQHLVRIQKRTPGGPRPYEAVEELVRADWRDTRRDRANANASEKLLERYTIERESSE